MYSVSNTENQQQPSTKPKTSRWDRKERRIGFNLSKLVGAPPPLSTLENPERILLGIANESAPLNGIKVACAMKWSSTAYTKLTEQQIHAVIVSCRADNDLSALVADPIAYFDNVAGYKHVKPTTKTRQRLNTGVFATITAA